MPQRILALCLVTGSCLLVAELVLRLFAPMPLTPREVGRQLVNLLPGLAREVWYEKDDHGFREPDFQPLRKPDGAVRVLCLGASTTDQATQNVEDTWCALLGEGLRERFSGDGASIETASWATGGVTAVHLWRRVRAHLLDYRPDVVTILMGINDLTWNGGPGYAYSDLAARERELERQRSSRLEARCLDASQLCRRTLLAKERLKAWWKLLRGDWIDWHSRNLPGLRRAYQGYPYVEELARDPDPIVEFGDAMGALVAFLRDAGVEVVVLGQPVLWSAGISPEESSVLWFYINTPAGPVRPSGAWLEREMARYNAVQRRVAERSGAAYVDLDRRIPKTLENYFDDCHFTDRGSRRVATAVLPEVATRVRAALDARRTASR